MPALLWALLAADAAVFLVYAWDKLCAIRGRRRVPEARLLLLSAPFTAPGAWLAVLLLRHKSSKPRFLVPLALITAVEALVAGYALARGWASAGG